jgi:hypothetical protein
MSPTWTLVVSVGGPLVSAIIAALFAWHASHQAAAATREANEISRFEKIIQALERRVSALEGELETVKQERLLALRYIRVLITWARGSRHVPMPVPPPELEADL